MVTRDEFRAFLQIVGAVFYGDTKTYDHYKARVEDATDLYGSGVDIEWDARDDDEPPVIRCSPTEIGHRWFLSVEAPAADWELVQTVDDHNLLTKLTVQTSAGVEASAGVYGPPAKEGPEEIRVEADADEHLLERVLSSLDTEEY